MVTRFLQYSVIAVFGLMLLVWSIGQRVGQPHVESMSIGNPESEESADRLFTVWVADVPFEVSVAADDESRVQGLSGTESLLAHEGKLFIFPVSDLYGFWMPEMNFPIDILWFAADGSLVHMETAVTPESYPKMFAPKVPARYVLEVNAGLAATHGFTASSTLVFSEELTTCLATACIKQ